MMKRATIICAGLAMAGLVAVMPTTAHAQKGGGVCVDKGGRGTGSSTEDARFQAWEAVLQATDWGMWASWMGSGAKVGSAAAGYKVSNVRQRCGAGGSMGHECIIRARLCK